jgi:hypothetical protein
METLITPPLAQDNEYRQATLAVAIGQMKGLHAMISALMPEVAGCGRRWRRSRKMLICIKAT